MEGERGIINTKDPNLMLHSAWLTRVSIKNVSMERKEKEASVSLVIIYLHIIIIIYYEWKITIQHFKCIQ